MTEEFNKIINNKDFEEISSMLVIQRKKFSNEVIDSQDLMGLTLAHLTFVNCRFSNVDFYHTLLLCCNFTNCYFTKTSFFKSDLEDCNFTNCEIVDSDLGKGNFLRNNLTKCYFENVMMVVASFTECEWRELKFHNVPTLKNVILFKSKICNSKKCIEADSVDDISKLIDDFGD
jgi:uncharacterized protein YjbI with pentapeptide repeats